MKKVAFDGRVPVGERGDGCLFPTPGIIPQLPEAPYEWLLPRDEIDDRMLEIKDIVLERASKTPWIFQGSQGSCCACSFGHIVEFLNEEEGDPIPKLSQATIYAWDGVRYGASEPYTVDDLVPRKSDNGMTIAMGLLIARAIGIAPATVIDPMDWGRGKWPEDWLSHSDDNKVLRWRNVSQSLDMIKSTVARGLPVSHGFDRHARMLVWRDLSDGLWHCKNSWETQPWHYLTDRQVDDGRSSYGAYAPISSVAL